MNITEIKSYLEMLFCVCDLDGNSKLTFDEVNSEMCLFDSPPSEEEFYKADADNDREVTLEEALAISNSLFYSVCGRTYHAADSRADLGFTSFARPGFDGGSACANDALAC